MVSLYSWWGGKLKPMTVTVSELLGVETLSMFHPAMSGHDNPAIIQVPDHQHATEFVHFIVKEVIFNGQPPVTIDIQIL